MEAKNQETEAEVKPATEVVAKRDLSPQEVEWRIERQRADYLFKSGLLPKAVTNPYQALAIIQRGKELGIPPMESFEKIHIIDGKTGLAADKILGLFLSRIKGARVKYLTPLDKQHLGCKLEVSMEGAEPAVFEFTIEDAKKAGLVAKQNWQKYPGAMCRARAITAAIRAYAPHATAGAVYTPEELGNHEVVEGELA